MTNGSTFDRSLGKDAKNAKSFEKNTLKDVSENIGVRETMYFHLFFARIRSKNSFFECILNESVQGVKLGFSDTTIGMNENFLSSKV